jgi:TetR/AcrR family transcriptional repressor of nem operon
MPTPTPTQPTRQAIIASARIAMARKGYSAVGLNAVLADADVPKGSFYHYFASKDAAGEAVLEDYFAEYLADMDRVFAAPDADAAQRLMSYWDGWRQTQSADDCQGRCLAVKLGAEVADLSDPMRLALKRGTTAIVDRLERAIRGGIADGSLSVGMGPRQLAEALYDLWLGASVMAKIHRTEASFDAAEATTRHLLGL